MQALKMAMVLICLSLVTLSAKAFSAWDGSWVAQDSAKVVRLSEFNGQLTMSTRSYYSNGAPSDYFFEFTLPQGRDTQPGEILQGTMRSLDGLYGCAFEQSAEAQLDEQGNLRLHFPLLTFFRRTTSVNEGGRAYQRTLSWDGWEWVESISSFPIENWRVISSECVITQTNWTTSVLQRFSGSN